MVKVLNCVPTHRGHPPNVRLAPACRSKLLLQRPARQQGPIDVAGSGDLALAVSDRWAAAIDQLAAVIGKLEAWPGSCRGWMDGHSRAWDGWSTSGDCIDWRNNAEPVYEESGPMDT